MNSIKSIRLIHGRYNPEDAKEIILSLISSKIDSINIRNQSVKERTGLFKEELIDRRKELINDRNILIDFLDNLNSNSVIVNVESDINITISNNS